MTFWAKAGSVFDRVLDVCAGLACAIIAFQIFSVSLEVIVRQLFSISFQWVIPVNEWGLIYLTFLGAAWLQREKGHIGDDSIAAMFPRWIGASFKVIGTFLGLAACTIMTVYGTYVTWQRYDTNAYDFFKLETVPIYFAYLIIPIGSFLWLIQLIREIVQRRRQQKTMTA